MRLIKSDKTLNGPSALQSRVFVAADEFAAHKAAVIADGGAIYSDADTLALISDLIATNTYGDVAIAVSAYGGFKGFNTAGEKLYSPGPRAFLANTSALTDGAFVGRNMSSFSVPALSFPNGGEMYFDGFVPRRGANLSVVITHLGTGNAGPGEGLNVDFTVSGLRYIYSAGSCNHGVIVPPNNTNRFPLVGAAQMRPQSTTTSPFVAAWRADFPTSQLWLGQNGGTAAIDGRDYEDYPSPVSAETAKLIVRYGSSAPSYAREIIVLSGNHSIEAVRRLAAARKARV